MAGISKQAVHQRRISELRKANQAIEIFEKADKIRKVHPGAGCRKVARELIVPGWGRDKIEWLLLTSGYRLRLRPRYKRTTYPQDELYFPNLIEGMQLDNINQVVETDITYYRVKDTFYYLVFMIDAYSKHIVGFAVSRTLEAEGNIKALQRMLQTRKGHSLKDLIHHSDRGSQYIDKEYLKLLRQNEILISMCNQPWDNCFAERINRTIKEEYLDYWRIDDFAILSRCVKKAVNHYNRRRRHDNLGRLSPIDFENQCLDKDPTQRPKLKLHKPLTSCPQKNVNRKKKKEAKKKR